MAYGYFIDGENQFVTNILEVLRGAGWLLFLAGVLSQTWDTDDNRKVGRLVFPAIIILCVFNLSKKYVDGTTDFDLAANVGLDLGAFAQDRQALQTAATGRRRTVERPAVDRLFRHIGFRMTRRGQVVGFLAQLALFCQQRQRAESVAALQRNRMIENMKNTHGQTVYNFWRQQHSPNIISLE